MRRACLMVSGADAEGFLQNLVTCDVALLAEGDLTFGALLTPQGKILFDFFVMRMSGAFLLETAAEGRDALLQRLTMYKLRAAVTVGSDGRCVRLDEGGVADPRSSALPARSYGAEELIPDAYDRTRIEAGVPEAGFEFAYGDAFPHDAGFDLYERAGAGVAMRKGCYVGQEVVSRMQHRGTARRRPVILDGPVTAGAEINADGRTIGTVGSVVGNQALAIVRLDRIESAAEVTVQDMPVAWRPSPLLAR